MWWHITLGIGVGLVLVWVLPVEEIGDLLLR